MPIPTLSIRVLHVQSHLARRLKEVGGEAHLPLEGGAGGEVAGPVVVGVIGEGEDVILAHLHVHAGVHAFLTRSAGHTHADMDDATEHLFAKFA